MEISKKKILFVSHDASRSGAPIVLLTFLTWLKSNTNTEITILLKKTGELYDAFANIGETYCWVPGSLKSLKHDLTSRIKRKLKYTDPFIPFPRGLESKNYDLIYLNTVVCLDLAYLLKEKFKCPVLAHIHENSFIIKTLFNNCMDTANTDHVDFYIAVSNSTKEDLVKEFQIPQEKIAVIYEFIDISKIQLVNISTNSLRNSLKLNDDDFIVGGSGIAQWRKGIDLFLYTAAHLHKYFPNEHIKFIWVGEISSFYKEMLEYEIERLDVKSNIIFTGSLPDPHNYFQLFDIFFLSSREDPFPLVCLEAAALRKPVICFQHSGGMNEFAEAGGGINVPYADIESVTSVLIKLKNNDQKLNEMGINAAKTAVNYDVNKIAPIIMNLISGI